VTDASEFDLLVMGGGMAGMSAAAEAALSGARVVVCETSNRLGGTALLSTGNVWTVQTAEAFRAADPDGDTSLWQVVRDNLDDSLDWIAGLGVPVRERHKASSSSTYDPPPIGRNIDIETFMTRAARAVSGAGGLVLHGTTLSELETTSDGVTGGRILTIATGDQHEIHAKGVVIASGGFQMNPELRARYLGEVVAKSVALRSNPHSQGAGLLLALQAGATTSSVMDTFYGVILPAVPGELTEADYRGLVLHGAVYGIVLGPDGTRIADESSGAVGLANAVARVGRAAFVVGDAMTREANERLGIDLVQVLRNAGGRGARLVAAPSVEAACGSLDDWGYDGRRALHTLKEFDEASREGYEIRPSRRRHRLPLGRGDLLVVEVQAAATSTFGGIRTDTHGQALAAGGRPLPGLFAAGVDQGGYNVSGYVGGLSRALVFGRRAAARALAT
jgi:succinate dehydrogenase/fumarate reductase flavoprotein subunit